MRRLLIQNGQVVDPLSRTNRIADILIEGNKIKSIAKKIVARDCFKIDARGKLVVPGLIDMHVHLRDPGRPDAETVESGVRAAITGGLTSIVCMPNTEPPLDNDGLIRYIVEKAKRLNLCNVYPIGCITKGRRGEEIAEFSQMVQAGAIGFSDDGDSVYNSEVLRRALEYTKRLKTIIIEHCLDWDLHQAGLMNEGATATRLGLRGSPSIAEEVIVARDILIARYVDAPIHLTHISTRGAVELIRQAKKEKVKITADTCPQYFILTEEALKTYDSNYKVNPPLRSETDLRAIIKGLRDGTIDAIASDHAPHPSAEKEVEMEAAPYGMIGMETLVGLVFTELVHKKRLTILQAVAKLTANPARILGLKTKGRIAPGMDADITIIDPNYEWIFEQKDIKSISHNTPFIGRRFKGKAVKVIVAGQVKSL